MRVFLAASAGAAVMAVASAASAQPVGTFRVEGRNPGVTSGPPSYTGVVTISRTGDSYAVVWLVGGARTRVEGRGLFQNGVFAAAYPNAQPAGATLVVYTRRGNTWVGRWLVSGNSAPGTEVLTPQ